jgi:hypothetical protein
MATWFPVDERIGAIPILNADTTQMHAFGERRKAFDATLGLCEFVYVKGVASGAANLLVTYVPHTGVTALTGARSKGLLGVMMAALSATTLFGWLQIKGVAEVAVNGTVVAGATVYLTATAGKVDDAVVAGDIVYGANFATADGTPSANIARVSIAEPYCGDTDNA